jgi:hypothetical protein
MMRDRLSSDTILFTRFVGIMSGLPPWGPAFTGIAALNLNLSREEKSRESIQTLLLPKKRI